MLQSFDLSFLRFHYFSGLIHSGKFDLSLLICYEMNLPTVSYECQWLLIEFIELWIGWIEDCSRRWL